MKFKNVSNKLTSETDFPGIGLGHDNSMVVMDFNVGSEHDIDVIIHDRKLVGAFISDNGPTNVPYFIGKKNSKVAVELPRFEFTADHNARRYCDKKS